MPKIIFVQRVYRAHSFSATPKGGAAEWLSRVPPVRPFCRSQREGDSPKRALTEGKNWSSQPPIIPGAAQRLAELLRRLESQTNLRTERALCVRLPPWGSRDL